MLGRRALPLPLTLTLALGIAACSRPPAPPADPGADPGPSPSTPPAPAVAPAAQPEPAPAPERAVKEALEVPPGDGGATTPLSGDAETVVDPGSSFRVVLAGTCRDARLLLLDAAGAAVPATEQVEVGATTVLGLSPAAALTPGSRYQLRLDGAVGRELHLGDRAYPPARYALRAAGEPPPPEPKATPKKRTRRR